MMSLLVILICTDPSNRSKNRLIDFIKKFGSVKMNKSYLSVTRGSSDNAMDKMSPYNGHSENHFILSIAMNLLMDDMLSLPLPYDFL